ncbi:MAG: MoxR family ATPase [bacterium]|nr:MoxR family ATPase [bacterium]
MVDDPTITATSITSALGIHGWSHLDAILLASLATESPLLLIGPHGTAKSLLVERLSHALALEMHHYNAALLNYDDLVGIPVPTDDNHQLEFISTPASIWKAEFVFFDEISRCRADLQNKMFPIIHERRVVGIGLEKLLHRWAAMNPPAPEELSSAAGSGEIYLGSEALDPALIDRFPFIVPVPNWGELSKEDRRAILAYRVTVPDPATAPTINLAALVESCTALIPQVEDEFQDWLGDYVMYVVDLLEQAQLPQSPRRARMLARSVAAVHAARRVLEGEDADEATSAELALLYGMPQTATDVPPARMKLIAIHRQAWEMMQYLEDDAWRQVMEELDHARRIVLADSLGFSDFDLSRLITQTLGNEDSDARQISLATVIMLAFRRKRNLDPSAFEPLAQLAYSVLEPRTASLNIPANGPDAAVWREIKDWLRQNQGHEHNPLFRLQRNFIFSGFPALWRRHNWKESLERFIEDLNLFGISREDVE